MRVCTQTSLPPSLRSANANSETTHGSRESRRFGKEHKYTRILYYINTHAGLYKYPCPPSGSYINTLHMTPSPSPLAGLQAGKGRREGVNHRPWTLREPGFSVLATQSPGRA